MSKVLEYIKDLYFSNNLPKDISFIRETFEVKELEYTVLDDPQIYIYQNKTVEETNLICKYNKETYFISNSKEIHNTNNCRIPYSQSQFLRRDTAIFTQYLINKNDKV